MRFYWVQSPVGRIATAAAPNADRMLEEIIDMREEKVEFVLSLLQVNEATEIGLIDEELSLGAAGIGFRQTWKRALELLAGNLRELFLTLRSN